MLMWVRRAHRNDVTRWLAFCVCWLRLFGVPSFHFFIFSRSFFDSLSVLLWRAREYWFLNVNFVVVLFFFHLLVGRSRRCGRRRMSRIFSKECKCMCVRAVCRVNAKQDIELIFFFSSRYLCKHNSLMAERKEETKIYFILKSRKLKAKRTKELKMVVCAWAETMRRKKKNEKTFRPHMRLMRKKRQFDVFWQYVGSTARIFGGQCQATQRPAIQMEMWSSTEKYEFAWNRYKRLTPSSRACVCVNCPPRTCI